MQRSKGFLVPGGGSTRAGRRDGVLLWVADELQLHGEEREPADVEEEDHGESPRLAPVGGRRREEEEHVEVAAADGRVEAADGGG